MSPPLTPKPSFALKASTTFGLGYLRPASGTWGSLPPVILVALMLLVGAPEWLIVLAMALTAILFTAACVMGGDEAEARFGKKDPGQVVADETAGMALAILILPAQAYSSLQLGLYTLLFAFLAFRAIDILKPWPMSDMEHVRGGWGIVLDDLAAGLLTLLIIHAAAWANAQRVNEVFAIPPG